MAKTKARTRRKPTGARPRGDKPGIARVRKVDRAATPAREPRALAGAFGETAASMGARGEWRIDPPPPSAEGRRPAGTEPPFGAFPFRPGMAWASGPHAGHVLHCALARAAGVDPDTYGLVTEFADRIGVSKQYYHRILGRAECLDILRIATRLGLYVITLPPASPGGSIRWVIGDAPTEVAP